MTPKALEKLAYTVECFLNATRAHDGPERTAREAKLVSFLQPGGRYAVHHGDSVFCYDKPGNVAESFTLGKPMGGLTVWCDGRKISRLDTEAYFNAKKLVMLGTAGLILTMPGTVGATPHEPRGKKESNSNNNNNNNNG